MLSEQSFLPGMPAYSSWGALSGARSARGGTVQVTRCRKQEAVIMLSDQVQSSQSLRGQSCFGEEGNSETFRHTFCLPAFVEQAGVCYEPKKNAGLSNQCVPTL